MTAPTRDHILAAAARLYGEHGFRGTTTRRIAEEAGVNEVTLFRLFGTKTALLLDALRTHGTAAESAALPAVPCDPLQELTDWCAHKRRSISQMRSIIRKAMSEYEENPEMPKCMTHGASQTYQMLRGYIERLAKTGFIKSDADGTAAAAMLMSAVFHDAIARDMMPIGFPQPSSAAPGIYARLCLRSLGYDPAAAKQTGNGRRRKIAVVGLGLLLGSLLAPACAIAQQPAAAGAAVSREISLADALQLAARVSHSVRTSEAGVLRARGQQFGARAQYLPQINASVSYQRTIESQFQAISKQSSGGGSGGKDTSGNSLANSPISKIFAAPNTAILGLTLAQNVFTAGRLAAVSRGADAARTSAEVGLDAARAQVALDVAQAYYDAVASEQLVRIADSTLAQTERTLKQIELSKSVGSSAEFDVLRARVARDNQRPVTIQALGNRDLALLRLRQLVGIPLTQPLTLTTPIRDEGIAPPEPRAIDLTVPIAIPGGPQGMVPDTNVNHRSSVRQAAANVTAQDYALRAQKWNRLPTVQLSSNYQRFAYPPDGTFLPNSFAAYYPNWTASLGVAFPVFSGGRLEGDRMVAEANLAEARQSYEQVKEFAALDARTALNQLEQAQAGYAASVGTDAQAARAYAIAEVRFAEGISTQVELQQSRTQYEQARLNRVLAARDLEVARLRVVLLKDLPVSGATAPAARR
ncbi:MAG TPA: TolC family protein [Gemmatimonadaceae bacterium]|nr:TolC family protein [Gemmatimonadaceae bacterium]